MQIQDFDPRSLVTALVEAVSPSARAKDVALSPLVYRHVPSRVVGDSAQLRQVLSCLVNNAVTFTDHGQIVISLTRDSETNTHITLRFAVSDTGIGIPPEVQEKLFSCLTAEPENPSGLIVAQRLVAELGGTLGVESIPTQGSTFWFSACFQKTKEENEGTSSQSQAPSPSLPRRTRRNHSARILVAEDDPVNQRATLHHLAQLGYLADVVENGREALEALSTTSYDVVLLDCQMPVMDGYEATREIRRRENGARHTVIVALTSLSSQSNREKCLEVGMDDYLTKPIERNELAEHLSHWLGTGGPRKTSNSRSSNASKGFEAQLIPIFLEDAPRRIEAMRAALVNQNAKALEAAAHTLKSSSALMNAATLSQLCATLEAQGERDLAQGNEETLRQLEDEFARVQERLSLTLQKEQNSPGEL